MTNHGNFLEENQEPMEQIRESIEGQQFIEIEFREEEEEEEGRVLAEQSQNRVQVPVVNQLRQHRKEASSKEDHLYNLESTRRRMEVVNDDVRRPFSPPFKKQTAVGELMQASAQENLRPLGLRVQKMVDLRDSLEELPPTNLERQDPSPPKRALAETEEGEQVEVVFDPVLRCYYDPVSHQHYDLRGDL